jgi:anti-anti-sigma regulatory factor
MTRETRVSTMRAAAGENVRISFEPDAVESIVNRVREALANGTVATVTIDMSAVERIDPGALRALQAAGEAARDAGKGLFLDRARTSVYKTVQIAKLGVLFKRVGRAV